MYALSGIVGSAREAGPLRRRGRVICIPWKQGKVQGIEEQRWDWIYKTYYPTRAAGCLRETTVGKYPQTWSKWNWGNNREEIIGLTVVTFGKAQSTVAMQEKIPNLLASEVLTTPWMLSWCCIYAATHKLFQIVIPNNVTSCALQIALPVIRKPTVSKKPSNEKFRLEIDLLKDSRVRIVEEAVILPLEARREPRGRTTPFEEYGSSREHGSLPPSCLRSTK